MTGILPKWNEPAIRVLMMPRDTNAQGTIWQNTAGAAPVEPFAVAATVAPIQ